METQVSSLRTNRVITVDHAQRKLTALAIAIAHIARETVDARRIASGVGEAVDVLSYSA